MKSMEDAESMQDGDLLLARDISVVAVPVAIFQRVLDLLAKQSYEDVGSLMNVLLTYKAQNVRRG